MSEKELHVSGNYLLYKEQWNDLIFQTGRNSIYQKHSHKLSTENINVNQLIS